MPDFGGVIRFTFNGAPLVVRARVDLEPADATYTAEDNQDGSYARYVQPQGPKADLEFQDSTNSTAVGQNWAAIMAGGPYNVSIIEDTVGVMHTFRGASFVGRPKVDRLKGIVSGITLQSPVGGYAQVTV